MDIIEFTDNYEDLSTDTGFQFKFYCERCGNGYMSEFSPSPAGRATGLLRAAGGLLGGMTGKVGDTVYEIQRAIGGPAHDNALKEAVGHIRKQFHQCSRCGEWMCDNCWNTERSMCKQCAPETHEELAAMQATATVDQMRERVAQPDYASNINVTDTAVARCPHCGSKVSGGKFCNECGKPLIARGTCSRCGSENSPDARFCSECGERLV